MDSVAMGEAFNIMAFLGEEAQDSVVPPLPYPLPEGSESSYSPGLSDASTSGLSSAGEGDDGLFALINSVIHEGGTSDSSQTDDEATVSMEAEAATDTTYKAAFQLEVLGSTEDCGASPATLCPVCSAPKTGKHCYYGGKVCISCRGFFRRSVQSNHYKVFECQQDGKCPVDSKGRKGCKYCRFQKCLENSMRISYVMTDQERKDRILKKNKDKKKKGNTEIMTKNFSMAFRFTTEDEMETKSFYDNMMQMSYASYFRYFASNPEKMRDFFRCVYASQPISRETIVDMDSLDEKNTKNFMFDMHEMSELTPFDRMSLITGNYQKLHGLYWVSYGTDQYLNSFMNDFKKYGKEHIYEPTVEFVMKELKANKFFNRTAKWNLEKWAPEYVKDNLFNDHMNVVKEGSSWFREGPNKSQDRVRVILIILISMFTAENIDLENKEKVTEFQNKYLWKLHKYLNTKYKKRANKMLHEGLMMIPFAENVHHIHLRRLLSIDYTFDKMTPNSINESNI